MIDHSDAGIARQDRLGQCSAMSLKYLGEQFDIHTSGEDLTFPHNENEKAQSEAANGLPFARYWMLWGTLTVNGVKMSKSLGNHVTVREALTRHSSGTLRFFILTLHYRSIMDYRDEALCKGNTSRT